MKIGKVSINVEYWKGKPFSEFEKALKGRVKSDLIKPAYDKLPKTPKPIVLKEKKKEKEVKEKEEGK